MTEKQKKCIDWICADMQYSYFGTPIIFVKTEGEQRRKHRKKRINKKWKKRYGCYSGAALPDGEIMLVDIPGASKMLMMTRNTLKMLDISVGAVDNFPLW